MIGALTLRLSDVTIGLAYEVARRWPTPAGRRVASELVCGGLWLCGAAERLRWS